MTSAGESSRLVRIARSEASREVEGRHEVLRRSGCVSEETSICIVDERRKVVKEGKVGTKPETIAGWLKATGFWLKRSGSRPDHSHLCCMMVSPRLASGSSAWMPGI